MMNRIPLTKEIFLELKEKSTHIEGWVDYKIWSRDHHYINEIYDENEHNKHLILHTFGIEVEHDKMYEYSLDLDTMVIYRSGLYESAFRFINLEPVGLENVC